jgi:hypothetical protein
MAIMKKTNPHPLNIGENVERKFYALLVEM